jgi:hypothetical protein
MSVAYFNWVQLSVMSKSALFLHTVFYHLVHGMVLKLYKSPFIWPSRAWYGAKVVQKPIFCGKRIKHKMNLCKDCAALR